MRRIALVTGASGLVGMQLLHQLFQSSDYEWVISIGRRTLALKHPKLVQIVVDFDRIKELDILTKIGENDLGGEHHRLIKILKENAAHLDAFSALGTTIKQAGSKEKFFQVDHDYVINFARWAYDKGAKSFFYVSALGADQGSAIYYNKVKGQIEEDLKRMPFDYVGLFQPSLLLGNRRESRIGEQIGKVVMKGLTTIGLFKKYKPIYDHQVAKSMVKMALQTGNSGNETITSQEMHRMTS